MLGLGITKGSVSGIEGVPSIDPPAVVTTTTPLTTIGSETATLEGSYTGTGVTAVGFDFGSDLNNLTSVTGTDTSGSISANVSGLDPETVYYYKAFATNPAGRSEGQTQQFTTTEAPAAAGSPFHSTYGETPYHDLQFTSANGTYNFQGGFGTSVSRTSSITDSNGVTRQDVLVLEADTSVGIVWAWDQTNADLPATFQYGGNVYYYSYAVEFYLFIPSSNSDLDTFGKFAFGTSLSDSFTSASFSNNEIAGYSSSDVGSWKRVIYGSTDEADTSFGLRTHSGATTGTNYLGFYISPNDTTAPGDKAYITDVKVYRRQTTINN